MNKIYLLIFSWMILSVLSGCGAVPVEVKTDYSEISEQTREASLPESEYTLFQNSAERMSKKDIVGNSGRDEQNALRDKDFSSMQLMPNVSLDMQSADYWIDKLDTPDEIIMTPEKITEFNQSIRTEKAEINKYLEFSKKDGSRNISQETLTAYLDALEIPEETCYMNGSEVAQSYWDQLVANENRYSIEESHPVAYGFAVRRASMRGFPTEDVVYTGGVFTFYDEIQLSSLLIGEPVIIVHSSKDKKWLFVITQACTGWVRTEDIAVSGNYESWLEDSNPEHFLIVAEDEFYLDYDPMDKDVSERQLTMGTKLPLVSTEEYSGNSEGRQAYGNYIIRLPVRDDDGSLLWKYAFVPVARNVSEGYLKLTQRNILRLAFDCLGDRYGWGGMYNARDCSLYIMEVFRCFGIILPRNTTGLSLMNARTIDVEGLSVSEKEKKLNDLPVGSIICIKGHAAIYIGRNQDNYYTISASAAPILDGTDTKVNVQSVVINDLNAKRSDGNTWITNTVSYKLIQK